MGELACSWLMVDGSCAYVSGECWAEEGSVMQADAAARFFRAVQRGRHADSVPRSGRDRGRGSTSGGLRVISTV